MTGLWKQDMAGWMLALAALPPAVLLIAQDGAGAAALLALAAAVTLGWQLLFRVARGVPLHAGGAVTAVALVALSGPETGAVQIALAASFGVVMAELVFGGWGRNLVSAPTAALAFLYLAFPGLPHPAPGTTLALASLPGALILVATGFLSWRVLAGAALGAAAVLGALNAIPSWGALVFGAVFLIGDPVTAAATGPGRWIYGLLAGALAALFATAGPGMPQAMVFAALLAAIFAPLIDHAAIAALMLARSRRHG